MPYENEGSSRDEAMEQLKALGYINPGAGSSMFQIILARFLKISARFRSMLKKLSGASRDNEQEN